LMTSALIPWGKSMNIGGREISLQVANLNIGILYIFAIVSVGIYGIMIGGWASNNKFALLGAIRASSQMISYELAMGMAIIAILLTSNSLNIRDIVDQQEGFKWNVFYQPLGFLIFIITAFAECNRTPFDLPETETELVGGYHTEYSSMKLGLYLFAEYTNMFISSAVISCLYFGGYHFPGIDSLHLSQNVAALVSVAVLFSKTFFFILFFMWVRWTLPRFRYDQLMRLGWQVLLPLAIVNVLITGAWLTYFK
ncbi:MAG: complex I subunit 1 family protein, partial [Bacteroidota bacterium]